MWLGRLALPGAWSLPSFFVLMLLELAIPAWASTVGQMPWHAHHIAERYGLFTIIELGECVLGATNAVAGVIAAQGWSLDVALVGLGTASLVLALWWLYFLVPNADGLHHHRERAFSWAYGHFVVFSSLAALGAFLKVVVDQPKFAARANIAAAPSAHAVAPTFAIGLVAAAVGIYLLAMWWLHRHIAHSQARLAWAWCAAQTILVAVVAAVATGLSLAVAIPAMTLAPAFVIVVVERGRLVRPDLFNVQ